MPIYAKHPTPGFVVPIKFSTLFFAVLSIVLLLQGCNNVAKGIRKVTYPPEFNYISNAELSETMQQFALYTTLLDQALRDSPRVSEDQLQSAISILGKMEKLSLELGTETLSSNHDIISFNIDRFRQNIAEARRGLLRNPPEYYRAGAVSAYCLNCHALGR